jgi:hypothetical protein
VKRLELNPLIDTLRSELRRTGRDAGEGSSETTSVGVQLGAKAPAST